MMEIKTKVLIIDDSKVIYDRLNEMLADINGLNVIGPAESVATARHLIELYNPDVLTLDLQLKDGNGLDVLREVKGSRPQASIIVLTNHANPFFKEACKRYGADFFLDKTTEFEKVKDIVQNLVSAV